MEVIKDFENLKWHKETERVKDFKPNKRYLVVYEDENNKLFYILSFRSKRKEEWTKRGVHYLTEWEDWDEPLIQNIDAFRKHPYNTVKYWAELPDFAY